MHTHKFFFTIILCLSNFFVFGQDLVAHYAFNGSLADSSANSFDGTPIVTANFNMDEDALIIENTIDNGVSLNHQILDNLTDFTIAGFIKINDFNSNNNLISVANSGEADELIIGYNSVIGDFTEEGWHIRLRGDLYYFEEDLQMDDLEYHCLAVVRQGEKATLFLDGEKIGEEIDVPNDPLQVDANGLVIGQDQDCLGGCFNATQTWGGEIGDLSFYDGAVNVDDLQDLCASYTDTISTATEEVVIANGGIPNAFTPNNDSVNDIFKVITNQSIEVTKFTVFNRWGTAVFQSSNNDGWNGEYNGKIAPSGTYIYSITIKTTNGEEKTVYGDVTLIR